MCILNCGEILDYFNVNIVNDGRRRLLDWLSQEDIFQGCKKEIDLWSVEIVVEKD